MSYFVVAIVGLGLLGFLVYRFFKWLKKMKREDEEIRFQMEKHEDMIRAMPIEEAKRRVLDLIAKSEVIETTRQPIEKANWAENLAPSIREILLEFETVRVKKGLWICEISRKDIKPLPASINPVFIRIGSDSDDEEIFVCVKPLKDGIFLIAADELNDYLAQTEEMATNNEPDWPDYPSIYHWFCDNGTYYDDWNK